MHCLLILLLFIAICEIWPLRLIYSVYMILSLKSGITELLDEEASKYLSSIIEIAKRDLLCWQALIKAVALPRVRKKDSYIVYWSTSRPRMSHVIEGIAYARERLQQPISNSPCGCAEESRAKSWLASGLPCWWWNRIKRDQQATCHSALEGQ